MMLHKKTWTIVLILALATLTVACENKEDPPPTEQTMSEASAPNTATKARPDPEVVATKTTVVVMETPPNVYDDAVSMSPIFFGYDKAKLGAADKAVISSFYETIKAKSLMPLTLVGHADEPGGPEYNKELGMKRAKVVKDYLVDLGANADKIRLESEGETDMIVDTNDRHWKNRRVEFRVDSETSASASN